MNVLHASCTASDAPEICTSAPRSVTGDWWGRRAIRIACTETLVTEYQESTLDYEKSNCEQSEQIHTFIDENDFINLES